LISPSATVLDVGCGDGLLAREIKLRRPDVEVARIDVLVRSYTHVVVGLFDGRSIPHGGGAFESVMMVDVLLHTDDRLTLLREAMRVARRVVILKDHTMDTPLSGAILRLMDDVGNERHGVRVVSSLIFGRGLHFVARLTRRASVRMVGGA
jgi:SAM-dependent methyltransferase